MIALLAMASGGERGPVQVRSLAEREGIPVRFLEKIMNNLRKGGLVESVRGIKGGYVLARSPGEIKVADVFQAIEGPITPMVCLTEGECPSCLKAEGHARIEECMVREVWGEVKASIVEVLASLTLRDICERRRKKAFIMGE